MDNLKKWHLKPLDNGNFVLDGYNDVGFHFEREIRHQELKTYILFQDYLQFKYKDGKEYQIWWKNIDFARPSVPLYIRRIKLQSNYFHAIYAVIAEVSNIKFGYADKINMDYLRGEPKLAKFWVNQKLDLIIKVMCRAAGIAGPSV